MTDYDNALSGALTDRPWLARPTVPRDDRQTFELGFRAEWEARTTLGDSISLSRALLERLLDGDHAARVAARAAVEGWER